LPLASVLATLLLAAPASAQTATQPETDIGASAPPPPDGVDVTLLVVVLVAALALADLTFHAVRARRRAPAASGGEAVVLDERRIEPDTPREPHAERAPRPGWTRTAPPGPRERARSRPAPAAMRATVGAAQTRAAPRGARGPRGRPR
jgi:hypothetical protein